VYVDAVEMSDDGRLLSAISQCVPACGAR